MDHKAFGVTYATEEGLRSTWEEAPVRTFVYLQDSSKHLHTREISTDFFIFSNEVGYKGCVSPSREDTGWIVVVQILYPCPC